MKKLLLIITSLLFLFSCEKYENGVENETLNYGFKFSTQTLEVDDLAPAMKIKVFRSKALNESTTVNVEINTTPPTGATANSYTANQFTFNGVVTFAAGATEADMTITFNPANLVLGEEKVVNFKVVDVAGATKNISAFNSSVKYKLLCKFNTVKLDIKQDRWGSETTWKIKDANNITVAQGGPFTDLATNTTLQLPSKSLCLQNGNYTLWFYDSYGDGMVTSASIYGAYTLKKADGTTLVSGLGNAFTTSISHPFSLP